MEYFDISEFDQKDLQGSGENMCKEFLVNMDILRKRCGFPLYVSSGWRSPEYNNEVSSTGFNGPHTTGKACDVLVSRWQAYIVLREAMLMGCFTGIGIAQKGDSRFIHLDSLQKGETKGPRPTLWSY